MTEATTKQQSPDWYDLLEQAVKEPGELSAAHKYFHQYSLANRWLASTQLRARGLPLMPINTFKGWLNAKRPVQKGEKASIALIMPVPIRKQREDEDDGKGEVVFTKFMLRNYWFHLGQTDGEEYSPEEKTSDDWDLSAALDFLEIKETEFVFSSVSDTCLGYAESKRFAVSPLETHPMMGRIRQIAHILLGHTAAEPAKGVPPDAPTQEIEAQTTAYLVAATLGLSGMEETRLQIQSHLDARTRIPDRAAHRAFSAADKILNAGYC